MSRTAAGPVVLSAFCLVKSDPITGFSSGKNFYSVNSARFTIYRDYALLSSPSEMTCQRDHTVFITRPGWLRTRLFIRLGNMDDAIEIIGRNRKIIGTLKHTGYRVEIQPG